MDDSAALVIEQLIDTAIEEDTQCIVMGYSQLQRGSLQALEVLHRVPRRPASSKISTPPGIWPTACSPQRLDHDSSPRKPLRLPALGGWRGAVGSYAGAAGGHRGARYGRG